MQGLESGCPEALGEGVDRQEPQPTSKGLRECGCGVGPPEGLWATQSSFLWMSWFCEDVGQVEAHPGPGQTQRGGSQVSGHHPDKGLKSATSSFL